MARRWRRPGGIGLCLAATIGLASCTPSPDFPPQFPWVVVHEEQVTLPDAVKDQPYKQGLRQGEDPDGIWIVPPETLPPGLALTSGTDDIEGTPTESRPEPYRFKAILYANQVWIFGFRAERTYSIKVVDPTLPVQIVTTTLPDGTVNQPYSGQVVVASGKAPYTWAIDSGTLPVGLTFNDVNGTISGTPMVATTTRTAFIVVVTDSGSPVSTATQELEIVIHPEESGE